MKKFLKSLKPGMLFTGLVSLVLGVVLLAVPGVVEGALRFILGGGLALFGVLEIVSVFARPNGLLSVGRMIPGILALAVGLVFLFKFDTFVSLLWTLVGIAVLIDGVYKLQYAFELKAAQNKNWWVNLIWSLIALIFAALLIVEPFGVATAMARFTGILLLANGIFDLVTLFHVSAHVRRGTPAVMEVPYEEKKDKDLIEK
ncbi:MAG: DUF308 domain-containing protein [Clostridia bacterium]|nr:DUF308 domain-containing protein [Clostridia bacterium]